MWAGRNLWEAAAQNSGRQPGGWGAGGPAPCCVSLSPVFLGGAHRSLVPAIGFLSLRGTPALGFCEGRAHSVSPTCLSLGPRAHSRHKTHVLPEAQNVVFFGNQSLQVL